MEDKNHSGLTISEGTPSLPVYSNVDNDQPTTCPECGSRTEFEEIHKEDAPPTQQHECSGCGHNFILEFDKKDDLVKRIMEIPGISQEQAEFAAGVLMGDIPFDDPEKCPKTARWARECYHYPDGDKPDSQLKAVDEILEGFGVEMESGDEGFSGYFGDASYLYVNMGDCYTPTVVYDVEEGDFIVSSVGDLLEGGPSPS